LTIFEGDSNMTKLLLKTIFLVLVFIVLIPSIAQVDQKAVFIVQADQTKTEPTGGEPKQADKTNRESFNKEANKMIQDLDKKISTLGKKVKKEGAKIKTEAKESWESLKAKQTVAKKKLKDLSAAGEEAWDKVKSEADAALEEVRKAYDKAVSYFK
jgi:ElaB/YqjD/DUF883 family membrane-anchored ribosome-binding protein